VEGRRTDEIYPIPFGRSRERTQEKRRENGSGRSPPFRKTKIGTITCGTTVLDRYQVEKK